MQVLKIHNMDVLLFAAIQFLIASQVISNSLKIITTNNGRGNTVIACSTSLFWLSKPVGFKMFYFSGTKTGIFGGSSPTSITESPNLKGWRGPQKIIKSKSLLQQVTYSRLPTTGCTGWHPDRSCISPQKEFPKTPWTAWSSALSLLP